MAGIAAAKTLHQHGFHNFIIIEGEDRIGGRVKTSAFGGTHVETGAHWIHFYKGNPLHELAKEMGVRGKETDYDSITFRDDNSNNVTEKSLSFYEEYFDAVQKVMNMSTSVSESQGSDMSLKNAFTMAGWKSKSPITMAIENFNVDFTTGYSFQTSSLKNDADLLVYDAEDLHMGFPDGYSTLINRMASDFLTVKDSPLKLGEEVNSITYGNNSVSVQTDAGNTYKGDAALVTFSIGVLQQEYVEFNLQKPDGKKQPFFRSLVENNS